ncbi:hypothetical protein LINGRAHAP2_LOCUS39 [Linum grandiflorum]
MINCTLTWCYSSMSF